MRLFGGSMDATREESRISTPSSSVLYQIVSNFWPFHSPLVSGGRRYGVFGSMLRRRKLAFVKSLAAVQVRPQLSLAAPRVNVACAVPSVAVVLTAVQVAPPSQESSAHIAGLPDVASAQASSRTSMPLMAEPDGMDIP